MRAETPPCRTASPSLAEWTIGVVPLALGLTVGNLLAEVSNHVDHYRAVYSARLALILATAAFGTFLATRGAPRGHAWRLLWSAACVAYLVHFVLTWFVLRHEVRHGLRLLPAMKREAASRRISAGRILREAARVESEPETQELRCVSLSSSSPSRWALVRPGPILSGLS